MWCNGEDVGLGVSRLYRDSESSNSADNQYASPDIVHPCMSVQHSSLEAIMTYILRLDGIDETCGQGGKRAFAPRRGRLVLLDVILEPLS